MTSYEAYKERLHKRWPYNEGSHPDCMLCGYGSKDAKDLMTHRKWHEDNPCSIRCHSVPEGFKTKSLLLLVRLMEFLHLWFIASALGEIEGTFRQFEYFNDNPPEDAGLIKWSLL